MRGIERQRREGRTRQVGRGGLVEGSGNSNNVVVRQG
jgi:hypothetical protein